MIYDGYDNQTVILETSKVYGNIQNGEKYLEAFTTFSGMISSVKRKITKGLARSHIE